MKSTTSIFYDNQVLINRTVRWNDELQSWIVLDPVVASKLLKSEVFQVGGAVERVAQIAEKNGIEIATMLAALHEAPLTKNGEEHKRTRRQFAAKLMPRMNAAVAAFSQACAEQLAAILQPGKSADLFVGLLVPAMNAALPQLRGSEISLETFRVNSTTQLFSNMQIISASRLDMLEKEMNRAHKATAPETNDPVMTLFAGDPTIGSLGESLIDGIRSNPGLRLSDIPWAEEFTRTSVAFTERIAASETEIEGVRIKKGDTVVIYLGAFEASSQIHFGAGAHRCLGEALARMMWDSLRTALKARHEKLEIEHVEYRGADFVFSMPLSIKVKVTR
jgi:cytochrome P450